MQVIITVLSFDNENDPDVVGMVAASAALTISGVPFLGPIAAAKVGLIDGQMVLNPLIDEMSKTKLDLVVAGTHDAVMMVESEAHELPETQMLEAVMFGHKHFQPVIQAIIKLADSRRQGAVRLQAAGEGQVRRPGEVARSRTTCAPRSRRPRSRSATTWSPRPRKR